MSSATLQLLQFENLLFCDTAMGVNHNDRILENGTVATVAVARGVSNSVEAPFWLRLRFALGGGPGARVERTYSEPTLVGFQILIRHKET